MTVLIIFAAAERHDCFAVDLNQRLLFDGILYLKMSQAIAGAHSAEAMLFENSPIGLPVTPAFNQVCNEEANPMSKRAIATFVCCALSLIGANGLAFAEAIGRYECNVVGTISPEPIGDRGEHSVVSYQFSCFGVAGLLKGAVYSAIHVSEWDGSQGTFLLVGGIHRSAEGFAVTQMSEGTGSVVVKDGKRISSTSSGKATFRLGSGTLAALSGKTVNFTSKSTGLNRFELEFTD